MVTGGAGFIGSHLVETLKNAGNSVTVLDNLSTGKPRNLPIGVRLFVGDVADPKDVTQAMQGVEAVFHLAAISSVKKSLEAMVETHRANQTGTLALLEAAVAANIPVVYASSAAVYGNTPEVPLAETAPVNPLSTYAADKLGSEHHAAVMRHAFQLPTLGLRLFNVYGPRQDPNSPYSGVVSLFARNIDASQPIIIHGDGNQTRDFVCVTDVVKCLIGSMDLLQAKGVDTPAILNVCTGKEVSILQLAKTMMEVWGSTVPLVHDKLRSGDIARSFGQNDKAQEALEMREWTVLAEGLRTLLKPGEQ